MKVRGSAPDRVPQSPTFRQLLGALCAEHHREVGVLLAEVQRLQASQAAENRSARTNHLEGPSTDDFSAVVPCIPFVCSAKHRPAKSRPLDLQQLPPEAFEAIVLPAPVLPAHSLDQDEHKVPEEDVQRVVDAVESRSAQSAHYTPSNRSISTVIRRRSMNRLTETTLWAEWEKETAGATKSKVEISEVWLQEALNDRDFYNDTESQQPTFGAKRTFLPLSPQSVPKMFWDLIAPFALLYDFVMIPMQVFAFEETVGKQAIEGIILLYWICDMIVAFNSAYFNEHGEVVEDYKMIAARYCRTWFFPDLAITGCGLFDTTISWAMPNDSDRSQNVHIARLGKLLRVTRIVRILRFGRIAKLHEVVYRIQLYFDSEAIAIAWGLCLNIFTLLVLNHITACLWYWIGSSDEEYTWLKTPYRGDRTFAEADRWEAYFVSLHWSLTLFTPASMSVQPENLHERIYAVVCLMLAMVVFASFVSTVTAGTTRLRHLQAETVEQGYKLRKFLRENRISADLVGRVIRYVDIAMRSHKKSIPKESVARLKWLSGPLHVELMWELSAPTLYMHVLFQQYRACSVAAMRQLCYSAITGHPVSKQDTVFSSFGQAARMYFIKSGSLVYKRATGLGSPRKVRIGKGDWLVEHVLWIRWVHHGTMKALTESNLMAVESVKFREVSTHHPDVLTMCSDYAAAFARKVRENHSCDLPHRIYNRRWARSPGNGKAQASQEGPDAEADLSFSSEADEALQDGHGKDGAT